MSSRVLEYQPGLLIFVHEFIVAINPCLKKIKMEKIDLKLALLRRKIIKICK